MRPGAARTALLSGKNSKPSLVLDFLSGKLDSRVVFSRASAAYYFDATGTLQAANTNVPRFDYGPTPGPQPLGLLIEEARTNSLPNPRFEGAVIGATAFAGANNTLASGNGLVWTVTDLNTGAGIPFVELSLTGTTTITNANAYIQYAGIGVIAATSGQNWSYTQNVRISGGALPSGGQVYMTLLDMNSGNTQQGATNFRIDGTLTNAPLGTQRFFGPHTCVALTTSLLPRFSVITPTIGTVVNLKLQLALPGLEVGPMPTSPILPPIGSPAASTRAADVVSMPIGATLGPQAGTLLVQAMSPYVVVPNLASRVMGQISDGLSNLIQVRHNVSDGGFAGTITNAGSGLMNVGSGVLAAGVSGRAIITYSRSRSMLYTNGSLGVAGTGGITAPMPSGMSLTLGHDILHSAGSYLSGYVQRLEYYPREVPGAEAMQRSIPH